VRFCEGWGKGGSLGGGELRWGRGKGEGGRGKGKRLLDREDLDWIGLDCWVWVWRRKQGGEELLLGDSKAISYGREGVIDKKGGEEHEWE